MQAFLLLTLVITIIALMVILVKTEFASKDKLLGTIDEMGLDKV